MILDKKYFLIELIDIAIGIINLLELVKYDKWKQTFIF